MDIMKYFNASAVKAGVGVAIGMMVYYVFLKKYLDQVVK